MTCLDNVSNHPEPNMPPARVWKTAVDPKSGRTYYYDYHTREAQWAKPLELATEEERMAIALKEQQQREFFAAMEKNILQSMDRGLLIPCSSPSDSPSCENLKPSRSNRPSSNRMDKKLVRTISSMGDELLMELLKIGDHDERKTLERTNSSLISLSLINEGSPSGSVTSLTLSSSSDDSAKNEFSDCRSDILESDISLEAGEQKDLERRSSSEDMIHSSPLAGRELTKPKLRKRNTCGTMYIGSTMAAPDKDALIRVRDSMKRF
jgi:hypothetical protein